MLAVRLMPDDQGSFWIAVLVVSIMMAGVIIGFLMSVVRDMLYDKHEKLLQKQGAPVS